MKLPINGEKERFEDLIYLSQIAQAMSVKTETELYRRNRKGDDKTADEKEKGNSVIAQLNTIVAQPAGGREIERLWGQSDRIEVGELGDKGIILPEEFPKVGVNHKHRRYAPQHLGKPNPFFTGIKG